MITSDTWVHHFEPESKRASVEWRHSTSPSTMKFKYQQSVGKVMMTVLWDATSVILVDFMSQRAIPVTNLDDYIDTLQKLKARIHRVRPALDMSKVFVQPDNARSHPGLKNPLRYQLLWLNNNCTFPIFSRPGIN